MPKIKSSETKIQDTVKYLEKSIKKDSNQALNEEHKTTIQWSKLNKRNFSGVLWTTVIITTLGIGFWGGQWWESNNSEIANKTSATGTGKGGGRSTLVKTTLVEKSLLKETSEFVGTLEAKRSVRISPEIDGRIVEILVGEGDFISTGQVIAKLKSDGAEADLGRAKANFNRAQARLGELLAGSRPEQISASRARLNQAKARLQKLRIGTRSEEIAASKARLNQAQARLAELKAGTRSEEIAEARARLSEVEARLKDAKSGSLLDEIAQAEAQIEAREAELELANQQVRRNRELRQEGAIAELTFQEFVKEERAAQARLEEAKRRLTQLQRSQESQVQSLQAAVEQQNQVLIRLQNGTRPEEIAQAEAEVAEVRSNLEELENGTRPEEIAQAEAEVAGAMAEVQSLRVELADRKVVAPFAGVVGNIVAKMGDFVSKGDTITTLTANQVLDMNLSIPLERRADLRVGLPVEITSPEGKSLGIGRVSFISPTVSDSQTVLAKADVNNLTGDLRDGQFVSAKVIWNQRRGMVVPMTAVGFQGEQRFVYVVTGVGEERKAKRQIVELGLVKGDFAEVVSGLQPGQELIVSGVQKLQDGTDIKVLGANRSREKNKAVE